MPRISVLIAALSFAIPIAKQIESEGRKKMYSLVHSLFIARDLSRKKNTLVHHINVYFTIHPLSVAFIWPSLLTTESAEKKERVANIKASESVKVAGPTKMLLDRLRSLPERAKRKQIVHKRNK